MRFLLCKINSKKSLQCRSSSHLWLQIRSYPPVSSLSINYGWSFTRWIVFYKLTFRNPPSYPSLLDRTSMSSIYSSSPFFFSCSLLFFVKGPFLFFNLSPDFFVNKMFECYFLCKLKFLPVIRFICEEVSSVCLQAIRVLSTSCSTQWSLYV